PLHRHVVAVRTPLFRGGAHDFLVAESTFVLVHEHAKEQCKRSQGTGQCDQPLFHCLFIPRHSYSGGRATRVPARRIFQGLLARSPELNSAHARWSRPAPPTASGPPAPPIVQRESTRVPSTHPQAADSHARPTV